MMRSVRPLLLETNNIECEGLRTGGESQEPRDAMKDFVLEQERKHKERTQSKSCFCFDPGLLRYISQSPPNPLSSGICLEGDL
jgi:hypothetical protein